MLTDDDIRKFGFESRLLRHKGNTITRWKDGIDIDYPVLAVEKFARAIERAAYEDVIKAAKEQDDDALVRAQMRGCIALVESLMQEQPK